MFTMRDHFSEASRTNVEAQMALNTEFAYKFIESVEKFLDLNVGFTKASVEEVNELAKEWLLTQDGREMLALAIAQAQPVSRRAMAYGCHFAGISANTQSEFIDLISTQVSETNKEVTELVSEVSKNAPLGLDRLISFVRAVFDHANAGYEQVTMTTQQALDIIESNLIAAANQLARAAEESSSSRGRAHA